MSDEKSGRSGMDMGSCCFRAVVRGSTSNGNNCFIFAFVVLCTECKFV